MTIAIAKIELLSPYCQSRYHLEPKLNKELADDYEKRTWRSRLHIGDNGNVVVPGMAFANCIKECAKFLGHQIPGKGKSTWTKHFEAGIGVFDDVDTGLTPDQAIEKRMHVPSTGVRGDGKRVMKSYPLLIPTASNPIVLEPEFFINNDMITAEVFAQHLQQAGQLIGIGAFRVRNNGVFGRFKVRSVEWIEGGELIELPSIKYSKSKV